MNESSLKITLTRVFAAPRSLVYEAWTTPEHLRNWCAPQGFTIPESRGDLRPGGAWWCCMVAPDGIRHPLGGEYREVVPNERLVFTHCWEDENGNPGHETLVTVRFADEDEGTRVTLEQEGFDSPESREGHLGGWTQCLDRLEENLSASLCEPFVIEREFAAPREVVWKAWTDREQFVQWFGPKGCEIFSATMDFRPGGNLHYGMRMPDGLEMWGKWIFREIAAPEKIVLANSFADAEGNLCRPPFPGAWSLQMLTTVVFEDRGGKTFMRLQWIPLNASAEERTTFNAMRGSFTEGWTGTFERLDTHLSGTPRKS